MTQRLAGDNELLGWQRLGQIRWHNGGTAGFSSFLAFDRPAGAGVLLLASSGAGGASLDRAGFRALGVVGSLLWCP